MLTWIVRYVYENMFLCFVLLFLKGVLEGDGHSKCSPPGPSLQTDGGIRQEQEEKERVMRQECEELNVRERRELDLRFLETSRQHDETRAAMRKYHDDLLKELIAAVKHSIGLSRQVGGVDASVQRREYRSRIREYGFDATSSPDRSQFNGEEKEEKGVGEARRSGVCLEAVGLSSPLLSSLFLSCFVLSFFLFSSLFLSLFVSSVGSFSSSLLFSSSMVLSPPHPFSVFHLSSCVLLSLSPLFSFSFSRPLSLFLRGFWDRGRVCGDRSVFVTLHRPAHSSCAHAFSLFEFCVSHLKCSFYLHGSACPCLITLLCVSILATLFRVSILDTLLRVIACDSIRFFFSHNLPPLNPQGSLDSIISHIGLS